MKGKVFLLVDSDRKSHNFDKTIQSTAKIEFCRLVNDKDIHDIILVDPNNSLIQETEIEDALNGKIFNIVLNKFKGNGNEELLNFVSNVQKNESVSYYAMNLGPIESEKLEKFFSQNQNKYKSLFAKEYVEEMRKGEFDVPKWIQNIKKWFRGELNTAIYKGKKR